MNKQTIIDTISPEIYAIECEDAHWAATQPGEYGRTKIFYQSDTAHNIVDLIWYQENELDDTEKVRLVFDIYRDMPCYTLLLFAVMQYDSSLSSAAKSLFWQEVRALLSQDTLALVEPVEYMLAIDFFAFCTDWPAVWPEVVPPDASYVLVRRVLQLATDAPFHLKELLYQRLVKQQAFHRDIYTSLRESYSRAPQQVDTEKALYYLNHLVRIPEQELAELRAALMPQRKAG